MSCHVMLCHVMLCCYVMLCKCVYIYIIYLSVCVCTCAWVHGCMGALGASCMHGWTDGRMFVCVYMLYGTTHLARNLIDVYHGERHKLANSAQSGSHVAPRFTTLDPHSPHNGYQKPKHWASASSMPQKTSKNLITEVPCRHLHPTGRW